MLPSLQQKAESFLTRGTSGVVSQAIDPISIMAFISAITTFIRGCRDQATAKSRIKEGGAVSYGAALKITRDAHPELKGRDRREKAAELVKYGTELTDPELDDLVNQANDIPVESAPTGIWPAVLLFCIVLFSSTTAFAQDSPKGIWPIDEEQNIRLDKLEGEVAKANASFQAVQNQLSSLTEAINKLSTPTSVSATTQSTQALLPQKVVVAPAGRDLRPLYNHSPAFMADSAGNLLNTTDQHLLDHGFTRQEISNLSPQQKNSLHGAAHAGHVPKSGTVLAANGGPTTVTISRPAQQYTYQTECNGRSCRRIRRLTRG